MNEDVFNMEIRKFLKKVGVASQREIEKAVYEGINSGKMSGHETLEATMTLQIGDIELTKTINGDISLE